MNLGFVVHRYSASEGTGGYVVRLVERLAARHAITVYAAEQGVDVPSGVRFVRVPAMRRPASATILTFPRGFARRRGTHDVLHAQGWVTNRADVVTAHIVLRAWMRATEHSDAPKSLGERLVGPLVADFEEELFEDTRAVIAPSQRAAADVLAAKIPATKVHVVPHGFPAPWRPDQAAARQVLGLPRGHVALFAGDARKNLQRVFAAMTRLREVRLAVASFSHAAYWLAKARAHGIVDRVCWLGPQPSLDLALAAADVLIHPTPYDTFGLVVAEAMAAGRPALTTRAAGISELFDDEAGWILPTDDAALLAEAWSASLDDDHRLARARAAQAVAARRPWELVAAETVAVYESLR